MLWRLDQKHVVPRAALVPTDRYFALGPWEATEDSETISRRNFQPLSAGSPASAELCNGLNLSKHGKFLQSGIGTEWLEGILGFLEKC